MSWLITVLRDVPDPRTGNARRHDLLEVAAFFDNPPPGSTAFCETTDADHGGSRDARGPTGFFPTAARPVSRPCRASPPWAGLRARSSATARAHAPPGTISPRPGSRPSARPRPSEPIGLSRTLSTGCSTPPSARTAPATGKDHGAENLAVLRKLALNLLRSARPDISIRRKRKRAGWSDAFATSSAKCNSPAGTGGPLAFLRDLLHMGRLATARAPRSAGVAQG